MTKGQLQEQLVRLYLRLNGFFTSGFISHSDESGRFITEIDSLAVRFPHHSEIARQVDDDPALTLSPDHIDFVFCEVKSKGRPLKFNDALLNSPDAIGSALCRSGIFPAGDVAALVLPVQHLLLSAGNPSAAIPTLEHGKVRIRAALFSPERESAPAPNEPFFLNGPVVLGFIWRCLDPSQQPIGCARNYGPAQWAEFTDLAAFFKRRTANIQIAFPEIAAHFHVT